MTNEKNSIRLILADYLHDKCLDSLAMCLAYLGLESEEIQETLAEMPDSFKERLLSRISLHGYKKSDECVFNEISRILKLSGMEDLCPFI